MKNIILLVSPFVLMFIAKVLDNALGTAKTILIQKNRPLAASVVLAVSNAIYFKIAKSIISDDGDFALYLVAVASGVGCYVAMLISDRFSQEKTFVNVIMSDDIDAMKNLRTYLASHHIDNVAADTYTLDWETKSSTITAYAKTKHQSRLIDEYIDQSQTKFKRLVNNKHQK